MTPQIMIPQCPICFVPITEKMELVQPKACSHVFCRPCAETVMLKAKRKMCVFCPAILCTSKDLDQVIISFGEHDICAVDETNSRPSVNESSAIKKNLLSSHKSSLSARGELAIRWLNDLAESDPLQWKMPSSGSGNDRGLVFVRVSRIMHEVGNSLESNDDAKSILLRLADAIANHQNCFHSVVELSEKYKKLQRINKAFSDDLARKTHGYEKELRGRDREIVRLQTAKTQREDELIGKMGDLQKRLVNELEQRKTAQASIEEKNKELEESRQRAFRYEKKYAAKKKLLEDLRKRRNGHATDSSLEVEKENNASGDEGEAEPPPTSSSVFVASQKSRVPEASSSRLKLDSDRHKFELPSSFSGSNQREAKPPKKTHLRQTLNTKLAVPASAPVHDEHSRPISHPASNPTPDFFDKFMLEFDPDASSGSNLGLKEKERGRPPRSVGQRPNTAGIPTNPLAARQAPVILRKREKKKQRLTLGEGSG